MGVGFDLMLLLLLRLLRVKVSFRGRLSQLQGTQLTDVDSAPKKPVMLFCFVFFPEEINEASSPKRVNMDDTFFFFKTTATLASK